MSKDLSGEPRRQRGGYGPVHQEPKTSRSEYRAAEGQEQMYSSVSRPMRRGVV